MQRLLNLDVSIEPHGGGSYTCVAKSSSGGEARTVFAFPFSDKDLQILVLSVVGSIGRTRRKARRIQSEERELLEDFGGQLFQAAFSGPVRSFLDRSLAAAESKNAGLRIRLRLPPELANIPWEYLYDRESAGFVSLSPETVLVRYVEMPRPPRPFPVSPPLRILAMISAPSDVPELESDDEWDKLTAALTGLTGQGMVQVDRLEAGTLAALQRPLRQHEYHVLHFVGHGMYDEDAQDGALALEGADGRMRLVTGRDLGVMLRGHPSLRLVVLNACEGARSARDDPFGGVAQALVRQGIPAVIAMQFEISDPAALIFSQFFYQAIADGLPVDLAMVEARKAMFAAGSEVEWATPVLYLRSPDGHIFIKGRAPTADPQAQAEADRQAREEAERQAKAEAERQAKAEADRQAREDADRQAREEADRQAREDADRQAKAEADRQAREEADRQAKAEADRQAREEAQRQAREEADRKARQEEADRNAREEADRARVLSLVLDLLAYLAKMAEAERGAEPIRMHAAGRNIRVDLVTRVDDTPETLIARANRIRLPGVGWGPAFAAGARDKFAGLLPVAERVLGPEHPEILIARARLAYYTGLAGDAAGARGQYAALLPVVERVLGAEHPSTLGARGDLAWWTGQAGDAAGARDQYAALLPVAERVLGAEHPRTIGTRSGLAYWTKQARRRRWL
jgi:CHAT domain